MQQYENNWYIKFFDIFIASILLLQIPLSILELSGLPVWFTDFIYSNNAAIPNFLFHWFWAIGLVFAAIYRYYWIRKETSNANFPSARIHSCFLGTIRYLLAFIIAYYAFSKILGVQFQTEYFRRDTKVSELNGLRLTWYYFGYSPIFRLILGYLQLIGSVLLLFRRTTLLGVFLLLPVMLNVLLVNLFYNIGIHALSNSLLINAGLTYLLLLNWQKISELLFHSAYPLPVWKNNYLKNIFRVGLLLFAFVIEYQYHLENYGADNILWGKWKVDQQMVNGKTINKDEWKNSQSTQPYKNKSKMSAENEWENDSFVSNWSSLYFEHGGMCAVGSNPYFFSSQNGMAGGYSYDAINRKIKMDFNGKNGEVKYFNASADYMQTDSMRLKVAMEKTQLFYF